MLRIKIHQPVVDILHYRPQGSDRIQRPLHSFECILPLLLFGEIEMIINVGLPEHVFPPDGKKEFHVLRDLAGFFAEGKKDGERRLYDRQYSVGFNNRKQLQWKHRSHPFIIGAEPLYNSSAIPPNP